MKQTLYLKTHNVTGKKYLGQTTRDPFKYKGSGVYWTRHIELHGNDVTTEILYESNHKDTFEKVAMDYSIKLDVVNNNAFANLVEEHGGSAGGKANPNFQDKGFTGRLDDPQIYKATDKIRNAIRHKDNPERGRCRMKARYYLLRGEEDIAKQWFDDWVLHINNQPISTKGNYKKKIPIWNEWKKIQKKG